MNLPEHRVSLPLPLLTSTAVRLTESEIKTGGNRVSMVRRVMQLMLHCWQAECSSTLQFFVTESHSCQLGHITVKFLEVHMNLKESLNTRFTFLWMYLTAFDSLKHSALLTSLASPAVLCIPIMMQCSCSEVYSKSELIAKCRRLVD